MTFNFLRPASSSASAGGWRNANRKRLSIDSLECRRVLTTFFVDADADAGGDGSANDPFDTIQSGIDAASESPGPDSVNIAPGTYIENLVIEDSAKLTIRGNGATVSSALGDDEHTIEIDDSPDVTIRDLIVINGDDGIRADDVGNLTLVNVTAHDNDDEGVQADEVDKLRVVNANLYDNGGDGLASEEANIVQVVGGLFNNNDDGIDLELVGSALIIDATAAGNEDEGLEVDDTGKIEVIGGVYTGNAEAGLDIDDTNSIAIIDVLSTGNGEHGLQIRAEDDGDEFDTIQSVRITNSVFSGNTGDGIQIIEDENTSIEDVLIVNVDVLDNVQGLDEDSMLFGGHGLFIDISGKLKIRNVLSEGNDLPDVLP